MAIIKKKTRKRLSKTFQKLVRKHGPEIAAGLVTTLVAGVAGTAAVTDDDDKAGTAKAGGSGKKKALGVGGSRKKKATKKDKK